jgi:hypothetical protein
MGVDVKLAEQMALAVLKGDEAAALALADMLSESVHNRTHRVPPVKEIKVDRRRLRVVLRRYETFAHEPIGPTFRADTTARVLAWLEGTEPLMLFGMHLELYELPEDFAPDPMTYLPARVLEYNPLPRIIDFESLPEGTVIQFPDGSKIEKRGGKQVWTVPANVNPNADRMLSLGERQLLGGK